MYANNYTLPGTSCPPGTFLVSVVIFRSLQAARRYLTITLRRKRFLAVRLPSHAARARLRVSLQRTRTCEDGEVLAAHARRNIRLYPLPGQDKADTGGRRFKSLSKRTESRFRKQQLNQRNWYIYHRIVTFAHTGYPVEPVLFRPSCYLRPHRIRHYIQKSRDPLA